MYSIVSNIKCEKYCEHIDTRYGIAGLIGP